MIMKTYLPVLLMATAFVSAAVSTHPISVLAAPKKAPCAVCVVKEGAGPEPVKATATYKGKEYTFCREECKKEFLQNPEAFLKPAAPRPAPGFTLQDLNGKTISLSDYKGKVVLLDFWATFCGPCLKAMPRLQKLHDEHAAQGFSVIGIATDEGGAKVVAPVVAKKKVTYPILISNEAAWKDYGVTALPAVFLIDRQGQIVKQFGGGTDHKTIEREVEKLLAGRGQE
jgi:peroxiredoxin